MDMLKDIKKSIGGPQDEGVIYIDQTVDAGAPSRGIIHLLVTEKYIRMTTLNAAVRRAGEPSIVERVQLEKYHELKSFFRPKILKLFGHDMDTYLTCLSHGHKDTLIRLPEKIIIKIIRYVGIENLHSIAPICKSLRNICYGNELWGQFFNMYCGSCYAKEAAINERGDLCWKATFFQYWLQRNVFRGRKMILGRDTFEQVKNSYQSNLLESLEKLSTETPQEKQLRMLKFINGSKYVFREDDEESISEEEEEEYIVEGETDPKRIALIQEVKKFIHIYRLNPEIIRNPK